MLEEGVQEFEEWPVAAASRTLFSIPITHDIAAEVFRNFAPINVRSPF